MHRTEPQSLRTTADPQSQCDLGEKQIFTVASPRDFLGGVFVVQHKQV